MVGITRSKVIKGNLVEKFSNLEDLKYIYIIETMANGPMSLPDIFVAIAADLAGPFHPLPSGVLVFLVVTAPFYSIFIKVPVICVFCVCRSKSSL